MLAPTLALVANRRPSNGQRLLESPSRSRLRGFDFIYRLDVFEQDGELVAARRARRARPLAASRSRSRSLQHTVTVVVAERVIDRLEIVHVYEQQPELLTSRCRPRQRATQSCR